MNQCNKRKTKMQYTEANYNPKARKTNDCVIRAITKATGKTWHEVFDGLVAMARQDCEMPNSKKNRDRFLASLGFKKQPMPRFTDGTRYTVKEFAETHDVGTFIISVANHLTVIVEGNLYDTWDCSRKSVCNWWE